MVGESYLFFCFPEHVYNDRHVCAENDQQNDFSMNKTCFRPDVDAFFLMVFLAIR